MTSKRQFNKQTIVNSPECEANVCNSIAITMKRMWEFAFTEDGNNRSSAKTDYLHARWEGILNESFGDHKDLFNHHFSLVVEKEGAGSKKTSQIKQIEDIFGANFKIDMLMTHEGKPHTVFLLKAPLTSLNKNRYNAALNNFGEIDRFYGNPANLDIELVFVNFTPIKTFTVDTKNNSIKMENVQYLGLNQDDKGNRPKDKLPKPQEIKDKVHEIHIDYDLNLGIDFTEIKTVSELKNLIATKQGFVSLFPGAVDELKQYVEHFLEVNEHILQIEADPPVKSKLKI